MSSVPGSAPSSGSVQTREPGRGGQQNQRGGRQRGGNRGRFKPSRAPVKPPPKKFEGKEDGLGEEYVYEYTSGREATDQYTKTTEEIIRYSSTKYKHGADVERSLADGMKIVIVMPATPTAVGGTAENPGVVPDTDMMVWKMRVQLVLQRVAALDANLQSAYAMIKGQCTKPILEKVEAQGNYGDVHLRRDPIGLLQLIKEVMFNYNSRKARAIGIISLIKTNIVSQTRYMTTSDYLEKFRTQLDVLKAAGGDMCVHFGMVSDKLIKAGANTPPTPEQVNNATDRACQRFEATLFLVQSN